MRGAGWPTLTPAIGPHAAPCLNITTTLTICFVGMELQVQGALVICFVLIYAILVHLTKGQWFYQRTKLLIFPC